MSKNSHGMMSVHAAGSAVQTMETESFARTPQMCTDTISNVPSGENSMIKTAAVNVNREDTLSDVPMPTSGAALTPDTATSSPSEAAATTDMDLLLIGKSGVGKSATGNSILGKKVFKSSASLNSETDKISSDVSKVKGRIIKVVDGPGVGDTRMDTEEGIRLFVDSMEHAMITNPAGYHAFLLVLRFGTRFTQEDIDTIALLKKVFGDDFVKNYCVLVMTCGDMFKYEAEDNGFDFPEWVQQQTGAMSELVKECDGRIVLFDNATKKLEEKAAQNDRLLELIGKLNNNGKRYTDTNFQSAMEAREKVIAESKVPMARDGTLQAITLLMQELGEIRGRGAESEDIETSQVIVQDLEKLLRDAVVVRQDVIEQDKGTGALKDLIQSVEMVEKSIMSSLELHRVAVESRQRQQESETEVSSQMRELEEQIGSARAEEEKMRLAEENKRLRMKMEKIQMEREEEKFRLRQGQEEAFVNFGYCQRRVQHYQMEREVTIFQSMKLVVQVIGRKIGKMFRHIMQ